MLQRIELRFDQLLAFVLASSLVASLVARNAPWEHLLLIVCAILGTLPVFFKALRSIAQHEWASMDMLASLALALAMFDGEWTSAVFVALMLVSARILEELTHAQTEKSIKGLLKLRPQHANVERSGTISEIAVSDLAVGDIIVVELGERIAVDGVVLTGTITVDESSLTGESLPLEKTPSSEVYSATVVTSGSARIEVRKIGKDTTLEKIIALVETARSEKPNTQTLGERFGKIYLVSIFIGSALLYVLSSNLTLVLAVVLVVCADDVAIAIPLAYLRGIGASAKRGVIIKGARHLESLGNAKVFIFDKTGTLTKGKLAVTDIMPLCNISPENILHDATIAAERSHHPIAKAITAHAGPTHTRNVADETIEEHAGKGVVVHTEAGRFALGNDDLITMLGIALPTNIERVVSSLEHKGRTVIFVAKNDVLEGVIAVADEVKINAKDTISRLRELGATSIIMLTGDTNTVAQTIAEQVGITDVRSHLSPEAKVSIVKELAKNNVTVMIGDGVNDAAALSAAHVGIAMGAMGSDAAIESAEIALMHDQLARIPETVELARHIRSISIQDFWIWGFTNFAGLLLVLTGTIGITGAAAYNFISDFFPLTNSMRRYETKK